MLYRQDYLNHLLLLSYRDPINYSLSLLATSGSSRSLHYDNVSELLYWYDDSEGCLHCLNINNGVRSTTDTTLVVNSMVVVDKNTETYLVAGTKKRIISSPLQSSLNPSNGMID